MRHYIGVIIQKHRGATGMTQNEYGRHFGVSGPAIFKFEKGYVRPSLALWMRIAGEARISNSWAVRIWLKDSLPEPYKEYVELGGGTGTAEPMMLSTGEVQRADYRACASRETTLRLAREDAGLPRSLLEFLEDEEMWSLYKPRGDEINALCDLFAPLGAGSRDLYREALYTLRLFRNP